MRISGMPDKELKARDLALEIIKVCDRQIESSYYVIRNTPTESADNRANAEMFNFCQNLKQAISQLL